MYSCPDQIIMPFYPYGIGVAVVYCGIIHEVIEPVSGSADTGFFVGGIYGTDTGA